ncbi:unnamed protein product [Mesocestoides corti]|uniref:Condensin complex subunit 1 n=1 Tax=Mesocestoides corti TaxID=53468 RepID=A0A158QWB0_MESCO|nr:unnamed protein product [Mesocestoides corti]
MLEFVIPVSRNDLLNATVSSYSVNEVVSSRHLAAKVQDCQKKLVREGQRGVLQYFDIFFSVLHEWKSVDASTKEDAWQIILKGCELSVRELVGVIKPTEPNSALSRSLLIERRNAIKMHSYLLCQFIETFENDATAEASSVVASKVGRGRGKTLTSAAKGRRAESDVTLDWPVECTNAITVLDQLCKLDIKHFWDPPIVEDDFVNLLANSCYKLLENKSMAANATVRGAIAGLLSTLIQHYKHGIPCCLKLAQMLQCFAHTANVLNVMVNQFMTDEAMIPFVKELLTEICGYDSEDLERDSAGTHNFCAFLESVSSAHPSLATSILPLIRARLSEDPYQMRNCALNVIGEVLRNLYTGHPHLEGKDKIQRDRLMDVLQEHIHDVNGFVRARALQIWCNIASTGGLPIRRQVQLAHLLVGPDGAVNDVSSFARKNALRLLTTIIVQSPAVKLNSEDLANVLNKEQTRLHALEEHFVRLNPDNVGIKTRPTTQGDVEDPEIRTSDDIDNEEESVGSNKASRGCRVTRQLDSDDEEKKAVELGACEAAAALEAAIHSAAMVAQDEQCGTTRPPISVEVAFEAHKADLVRQRACVAYLREMQRFAGYMATAIDDVKNMLHSKTVTDVLEAIDFFLTAKQAGVRNLDSAIRHMMAMIWSQEEQIRKAVLDACRRLYFQPDIVNESFTADGRLSSAALTVVISTLVRLISESTMGDFVSLEHILHKLLDLRHVDDDLVKELWRRFVDIASTMTDNVLVPYERRQELKAVLILLKMISLPSRKNLERHLSDLVNYGLGATIGFANVDLECAMYACMVIQRMIPTEQAVTTIFQLIDTPSLVMAEVLREIGEQFLKAATKTPPPPPSSSQSHKEAEPEKRNPTVAEAEVAEDASGEPADADTTPQPPSSQTAAPVIPSFILARFIALAGHVALKMLVHLEFSVLNEIKRREAIHEESKQARRRITKTPKSLRRVTTLDASTQSISATGGHKSDISGNAGSSTLEEEAALLGAVADDAEADYIRSVLNNEIVLQPDHLLARLLPLVVHASASLALVKFMLVSSNVCEQNLQLLFTLAERNPSEVVRANLIVGLGDLARRFPNLIEPWTPNLYARLRDPSSKVRINALNTLSHLIMNDMVKVKGQISEMTVCLVNDNDRLRQLSRLFFRELAQKGNALYNVMPDIISRLSDPEVGVDETTFRLTVDFLIPLIEKERLCETLVEKICSRFRVTQSERQWRDLAYCLRVMSFNERMVRTLQENLPIFAQQLSIHDVYQSFSEILVNAKKNAKADNLPQLEELEAKIEEARVADEEALQRAEVMAKKAAAKRRKTGSNSRKSTRRGRPQDADVDDTPEKPTNPRKTRSRAAVARSRVVFSSDEDED